jgi:hypothetical protein
MRSYRTFLRNQLSITSNGCTNIFDFSFYYSDVHIVKKPNSAHDNIHLDLLPKKLRMFQLETRQLYYCNPKEHVNKECMNVGTQSKKQYLLLENRGYYSQKAEFCSRQYTCFH